MTAFQILGAFACVSVAQSRSLKPLVYQGCFISPGNMQDLGGYIDLSPVYCQILCVTRDKPVMGTSQGSDCWCGSMVPALSSKVPDDECNSKCFGDRADTCESMYSHEFAYKTDINPGGGASSWSVQLTGLNISVFTGFAKSGAPATTEVALFEQGTSFTLGYPSNSQTAEVAPLGSTMVSVPANPSKTQTTATFPEETIIENNDTPSSPTGLSSKTVTIIIATVVPIVVGAIIAMSIFQYRLYRKKHPVEAVTATTPNPDSHGQSKGSSESTQLYLQRKVELDTKDHEIYEAEAHGKRHETQGTPLYELPAGGDEMTIRRQELRDVDFSRELDAPSLGL